MLSYVFLKRNLFLNKKYNRNSVTIYDCTELGFLSLQESFFASKDIHGLEVKGQNKTLHENRIEEKIKTMLYLHQINRQNEKYG